MAVIVSQYERYWLKLLNEEKLVIQVPTHLVASIKKAIIKRKYEHRLRNGKQFNNLVCSLSPAVDSTGKLIPDRTRITFVMPNIRLKDI